MIDFKLASELKDAGLRLPPGTDRDGYTKLPNGEVKQDRYDYESESWHFKGEHYFIPTLSQLIEVVRTRDKRYKYFTLGYLENTKDNKGWSAEIHEDHDPYPSIIHQSDFEKSPEEAVSNLFIILKKK